MGARQEPEVRCAGDSQLHWMLEGGPFRNTTLWGHMFKKFYQYPGNAGGM